MKNIKTIMREGRQKEKRVQLVGADGVNKQNRRREKAKTPKEVTLDVQQRMKEYRTGVVKQDKVIDKVKRYKNPGNK